MMFTPAYTLSYHSLGERLPSQQVSHVCRPIHWRSYARLDGGFWTPCWPALNLGGGKEGESLFLDIFHPPKAAGMGRRRKSSVVKKPETTPIPTETVLGETPSTCAEIWEPAVATRWTNFRQKSSCQKWQPVLAGSGSSRVCSIGSMLDCVYGMWYLWLLAALQEYFGRYF